MLYAMVVVLAKLLVAIQEGGANLIGPIVGASVGCVAVLLLILGVYWFYVRPRSLLNKLPAEVRWHYEKYFEQGGMYLPALSWNLKCATNC